MARLTQMCRSTNSPLFHWWVSRPTHLSQWLSQHVHVVIRCGKLFSDLCKGLWSVESLPYKDLLLMCGVFSSEDWGCSQDSDEDSDQDSASEEDFKPARSTRTTRKYVSFIGGGGGVFGIFFHAFLWRRKNTTKWVLAYSSYFVLLWLCNQKMCSVTFLHTLYVQLEISSLLPFLCSFCSATKCASHLLFFTLYATRKYVPWILAAYFYIMLPSLGLDLLLD